MNQKISFFFVLCLFSIGVSAQKIRIKVLGQKDTTVHLIKYFGKGLYYADTAKISKGEVIFDGAKQKPGILGLLLPGQQYFEFIFNREETSLETSGSNGGEYTRNLMVKKSEENKVFIPYVNYITEKKTAAGKLGEERNKFKNGDQEYKEYSEKIDAINKEVLAYQKELIAKYPNTLVSKIVKMSLDIVIPDAPVDANGNVIDSSFQFNYFRAHYWDNTDLQDERLVNNPIFHNKLEYYFSKNMMIQHWDTVIYHAFQFCDNLNPKSRTFEYCVGWIAQTFGKSQQMGMDKVYYHMLDRYFCTKNAEGKHPSFWVEESKYEELCKDLDKKLAICLGEKAPNLILKDPSDEQWVNLHALKAEYTILYFWDPECGHCKTITPKLAELYTKKMKQRGVEVYAVGKAIGKDFEAWKKFIKDHNLDFINVAVTDKLYQVAKEKPELLVPLYPGEKGKPTTLESLNYQTTYDIYSTPKVFILDKDKKIIAKSLSMSQIEDLLDNLQGQKDAPKIMEKDAKEDAQMQKKE
ncbi:MAG: thioredoxin-like domain-containing protein [Flavobacteriales bacterium]